MSEQEQFIHRIKDIAVRCSVRLNYILTPINVYELFDALKEADYEITAPSLPPRPPHAPMNISFSGPFAKKDETIFDGNTDRAFFGALNNAFDLSYASLNDLMRIIHEELGVDLSKNISFYEIQSSLSCSSRKNPIEEISGVFDDCTIISKINGILKEETSLYNLKIVPRGAVPNQSNWFEITIEPDNVNPARFNIRVIFRNENPLVFEEFGNNMLNFLDMILQEIES